MSRSSPSSLVRRGVPDLWAGVLAPDGYLILVNVPISVAVAREFCSAACLNSCNVAPGLTSRVSVFSA